MKKPVAVMCDRDNQRPGVLLIIFSIRLFIQYDSDGELTSRTRDSHRWVHRPALRSRSHARNPFLPNGNIGRTMLCRKIRLAGTSLGKFVQILPIFWKIFSISLHVMVSALFVRKHPQTNQDSISHTLRACPLPIPRGLP